MADVRPPLPAALASIKELPIPLIVDITSYCTLHGKQSGGSCPECDKHFPDLVAARQIDRPQIPSGFSLDQVNGMVAEAVKQAMEEYRNFEQWKASPEGQAAAAAAKTAGASTPEHGPKPGDEPSGPVTPPVA